MLKIIIVSAITLMGLVTVATVMFKANLRLAKNEEHRVPSTIFNGTLIILFGIMGTGASLKLFVIGTGISLGIPGLTN